MFVEDGMTVKAIVESLPAGTVTVQTVGKWRAGIQGNISWDEKRAQFLSAPHNLKKILTEELVHISKGGDPTIDIKSIEKISKVLDSLSDKVNMQIAYTVIKELDLFLANEDPEFAIKSLEYHKAFLVHKAETEN